MTQRRLFRFLNCSSSPVISVATGDTTPNGFTIDIVTNAELSTSYDSDPFVIDGYNQPIVLSCDAGCTVSVDGGPFVPTVAIQPPSVTVVARADSNASYDIPNNYTINAGTVSSVFTIRTKVDPAPPVQVWPQASFSIKTGKLTRVGHAAVDFGKLGGDNVTITGTNADHWQWQVVGTKQNRGLAPKNGTGAWGTAWKGASVANTYDLTLTDNDTGQSCTVHVDCNFTYQCDGMTYTAANCASAGHDFDLKNRTVFPYYGAPSYLKRTATDGGLVLLRDGYNPYENLYTFPQIASIGQTAVGGSDTGFVRGTWDDNFYSDGVTLHGDKSTSRRIKGYNANYCLIRPETPFACRVPRLVLGSTFKLQYCEVYCDNPSNDAGIYSIKLAGNDICITDCYCDGEKDGANASKNNVQCITFNSGSMCQNFVIKNCFSRAWARWCVPTMWKCRARNNFGTLQVEDWIRPVADTDVTYGQPYPADMSDNFVDIADNIHIGVLNAQTGAHPDLFQHYNGAGSRPPGYVASGPAVGGTITFQRNIGITTYSQIFFAGGGDLKLTKVVYKNNIGVNRCSNIMSMHQLLTGECVNNTLIEDPNTSYRSVPETWSIPIISGSNQDVKFGGNLYTDKSTPQISFDNQGTLDQTPSSKVLLTTATPADYQVMFPTWPSADAGKDLSTLRLSGITTYDAALAACISLFTPADVLESAGGAKRADGSWIGALKNDGSWNV